MYINRGIPSSLSKKFDNVFKQNLFRGLSSKSGIGSSLEQTHEIAQSLPDLITTLNIKSILDLPCGDLEWMSKVNLGSTNYVGGDVAPALIAQLRMQFPNRKFQTLNITRDNLPRVDLIFCRDLFVHLSNQDIKSSIKNIKASGSLYLATTTFTNRRKNQDLPFLSRSVAWRTINLELSPFNFSPPLILINERCTESNGDFSDKSIGIWKISDLP
jgi:hypothetical protein